MLDTTVDAGVAIPAGEPLEASEPQPPNLEVETRASEPEVPRESDVPTEEPESIDTDRSEPVPGNSPGGVEDVVE